ncbi:MAG TPA: carboxypeptidase-like regulatory domain-containing protein, partial [Pirellulales bacterium]
MNRGKKSSRTKVEATNFLSATRAAIWIETYLTMLLLCVLPAIAQIQPADAPAASQTGQIRGTVVDKDGALVANVKVTLAQDGKPSIEAVSDGGGN